MFTILSTKKIGFIHSKKQKLKPGQDLSGKGSADKRTVKKSRLSTFPPSLLLLLIILFFLKSSTKRRADGASGNRERTYCSTGIFVRKSLVWIRVKGRRPLRVRAEPANLLPQGNPRRQAKAELHKASRQACVHCRKAIPADRRDPNPIKQAARLAPYRREAVVRQSRHPPTLPKNRTTAKPAKRKFCAPPPEGGHFSEGERKSKPERLNFFEFPPVPPPEKY